MFKKEKFLKNVNILFNNLILTLYCPINRLLRYLNNYTITSKDCDDEIGLGYSLKANVC